MNMAFITVRTTYATRTRRFIIINPDDRRDSDIAHNQTLDKDTQGEETWVDAASDNDAQYALVGEVIGAINLLRQQLISQNTGEIPSDEALADLVTPILKGHGTKNISKYQYKVMFNSASGRFRFWCTDGICADPFRVYLAGRWSGGNNFACDQRTLEVRNSTDDGWVSADDASTRANTPRAFKMLTYTLITVNQFLGTDKVKEHRT